MLQRKLYTLHDQAREGGARHDGERACVPHGANFNINFNNILCVQTLISPKKVRGMAPIMLRLRATPGRKI
jgi:hypothetical protein